MMSRFGLFQRTALLYSSAVLLLGCSDGSVSKPSQTNAQEVITTVTLTFSPESGGAPVVAEFRDADGPGGAPPTQTSIALAPGARYALSIVLLNETVRPGEDGYDVTAEVREEAEQHRVLFGGTAVGSLVTVEDADRESEYTTNDVGDDLSVGLRSSVETQATGVGTFAVVLMHQPPINGIPVKSATSGISDGEADVDVTFDLTVR